MMYRQGDVLIVKRDSIPKGKEVPRDNGRVILAYGEVTGHAHAIHSQAAKMIEAENGERYMSFMEAVELVHEEHDTIALPPGSYQVIQQREYSPEEIRNVRD